MRRVVGTTVVVALALAVAATAGVPAPRVLVEVDRLEGFAQDGDHIVWVDTESATDCTGYVKLRDLRTGKTWSIYRPRRGSACDALGEAQGFQHAMALAGDRAIWSLVSASLSHYGFRVQTAGAHAPLQDLGFQETYGGSDGPFRPVPFAGGGHTLLYVDQSEPGPRYVFRADGFRFPASYGTLSLAADEGLFAAGRHELGGCLCNFEPAVSPDGTRMIFRSNRVAGGIQDRGAWFLTRLDGAGGERRLPAADNLAWSADGRSLVGNANGWAVRISPDAGAVTRVVRGEPVSWAPDGTQVMYGAADSKLWVAKPGAGKLAIGSRWDNAVWSPDGSRILVRDGQSALWIVDAATGARRFVTRGAGDETWSPDSTMIAFSTTDATFVVAATGGSPRQIHAGGGWYLWSPDSRRLAVGGFSRESHMWLVSALDGASVDLGAVGEVGQMAWSPTSASLAYVHRRSDNSMEVLVRTLDGGSRSLGAGDELVWSPDGGRLLIGQYVDRGATASFTTRVVSLDGAVSGSLADASPLTWLPSGKVIFRVGTNLSLYQEGELAIADPSLASPLLLTHTVPAPAWRGVEIRRSATGAIASKFTVDGDPVAVALDQRRVAVIVEVKKARRLEIRTMAGKLLRTTPVGKRVEGVSLSGRWAVFQSGPLIQALDITTGRIRTVARATGVTMGVSIEGTRVAWGEWREKGGNAILAVDLPR